MSRARYDVATIHSEGALLPSDLLSRIQAGDPDLPALTPKAYHLPGGMRLNEAAARSWNALLGAWSAFRDAQARLPEGDPGTSVTRERWLLPLFQELGYGRLETRKAVTIDGKNYALSHGYKHAPIHLVGCNVDLDRRTAGVAGAAAGSPHSLLQEFLNRRDDNLWGVASNGLRLRILRDNLALTRQAYLEFDLEAMMDGEAYSDFVLLYLVLHQSRLEAADPHESVLEAWSQEAAETGTRVLKDLSDGVETAIRALGEGLLRDRGNADLKRALRDGTLSTQDYYRQLLRLVYRLLFLFVAEDRDALHPPEAGDKARERYTWYGTRKLREQVDTLRGGRHPDAYERLKVVFHALGTDGAPELGLPALGSFLFSDEATSDVMRARLPNAYLYRAVRALAYAQVDGMRRAVDYKNLGSEELGGVYEGLLELHPEIDATAGSFHLSTAAGNERKTSGSYYTPTSLITMLLNSALDPVLDDRTRGKTAGEAERALLDTKVVDPAAGSGHFLIAAAQRMGKRLARIRTGDDEPAPENVRTAVRDVVGRCLYGVDVNPMSAELCKVALWMEALEPGKPLSFLDHHIRVGNSLIGTTRELLDDGIPAGAYKPLQGDDRAIAKGAKRLNQEERGREGGQLSLFRASPGQAQLLRGFKELTRKSDLDAEAVKEKRAKFSELLASDDYRRLHLAADAWCSAFVWRMEPELPPVITSTDVYDVLDGRGIDARRETVVTNLARQYGFFHWFVEFQDVFDGSDAEGFDVVLGNPPWERTAFEEVPYFAIRAPHVADAPTTAIRRERIRGLEASDPDLFSRYQRDRQVAAAEDLFFGGSERYPHSSKGRTNTFALFADLGLQLASRRGWLGMLLPTGIATATPLKDFWNNLIDKQRVVSLLDFENRRNLFPDVDSRYKFCALTCTKQQQLNPVRFGFFFHDPSEVVESGRTFTVERDDIALINPETKQPPVARSQRDLDLLLDIHGASDYLADYGRAWVGFTSAGSSESWELSDSGAALVPMLESKLMHQYDHRFATYRESNSTPDKVSLHEHQDPGFQIQARYWLSQQKNEDLLSRKEVETDLVLGYRDITNATNMRTMIAALLPRHALKQPLNGITVGSHEAMLVLVAHLNSFALDFCARQKTPETHLNVTIFHQLPVPRSLTGGSLECISSVQNFVKDRALELSYMSWELAPLGETFGIDAPFVWSNLRREVLRAELDALFFHLCRRSRDEVDYILETFPIVRGQDVREHGTFRTKELVLEIFDAMSDAVAQGRKYETRLDPTPADPSLTHSPTTRP